MNMQAVLCACQWQCKVVKWIDWVSRLAIFKTLCKRWAVNSVSFYLENINSCWLTNLLLVDVRLRALCTDRSEVKNIETFLQEIVFPRMERLCAPRSWRRCMHCVSNFGKWYADCVRSGFIHVHNLNSTTHTNRRAAFAYRKTRNLCREPATKVSAGVKTKQKNNIAKVICVVVVTIV